MPLSDSRSLLCRVLQDVSFNAKDLGVEIGYPRSSISAVARGEYIGRLTPDQRDALILFLEERREVIDTLLLEL
jgi:hypothetical protein